MNITSRVDAYWQAYYATLPPQRRPAQPFLIDAFGDTPELADTLGQLVLTGVKTATCSTLWEWEAEGAEPPTAGAITIVLDSQECPLCIIETTEVFIRPFNQVDAQFAYEEGEGDRSLVSWRRDHWQYWLRALPKIGKQPQPDMLLVCERFRKVHP